MNTEDIKRKCDSCKEPVSIDASKCPHCRSRQLTSRGAIATAILIGIIGLPFSYAALPVVFDHGMPSGPLEGVGTGLGLGIGIFGPVLILIGIGAYLQRRKAIKEAEETLAD